MFHVANSDPLLPSIRKAILAAGLPYSTKVVREPDGHYTIGVDTLPVALDLIEGVCEAVFARTTTLLILPH